MTLAPFLAAVAGILIGAFVNHLVVREPAYRITDPGDLPEGADPSLLDELEDPPVDLPAVPLLAIVRPSSAWRRWFAVTELVLAALFALTVHRLGWGTFTAVVLAIEVALVTLAATDLRVYRIPDRINRPATVVALALIAAASAVEGVPELAVGAVAGGATYAGLLFAAHVVSPRGMGWGDVKLAWIMGFLVGWRGADVGSVAEMLVAPIRWVLLALALGSVLGTVVGLGYAAVRRSVRAVFPYGPSLVGGCLIAVLWGNALLS